MGETLARIVLSRFTSSCTHPIRAVTPTVEKKLHPAPDLSPVNSRFCYDELGVVVREMEQALKDENDRATGHVTEDESTTCGIKLGLRLIFLGRTTETTIMKTSPGHSARHHTCLSTLR